MLSTIQYVEKKEASGFDAKSLFKQFGEAGILLPVSAGGRIPSEYTDEHLPADIKAKDWDYFHDFILWDELYRIFDHLPSEIHGLVGYTILTRQK